MRTTGWIVLTITALLGTLLSALDYSPLVLIVSPAEYFGDMYTAPPQGGATHVFFPGESVKLRIAISNWSSSPQTLLTTPGGPPDNLGFRVSRDGNAVNLGLAVDNMVRQTGPSGNFDVQWDRRMDLGPRDTLTVRADVLDKISTPGLYVIEVVHQMTDAEARLLRPQASRFQLEVRERSAETLCEIARRSALRAFLSGDYQEARNMTDQMLAANPQSFLAHVIRGDIAAAERSLLEADRSYELAIAMLEQGRDTLFLRSAGKFHLDDSLQALRSKRQRLSGR